MLSSIGHTFLNIAFGLYLILYLPQIWHNFRHKPFDRMSLLMHLMLFLAYSCDLFYGIARHMPWQYITVSLVGLSFLITQHLQWLAYRRQSKKNNNTHILLLQGMSIVFIPMTLFLFFPESKWQMQLQAWVARICFLLHFLPQILKYHRHDLRRDAINILYLSLSLCLSFCDLIAAICLHWDMANLFGSMLSLCLKTYLSIQIMFASFWSYQDR